MALLFCDGFDHVDDAYEMLKWDSYKDAGSSVYASGYGSTGGWGCVVAGLTTDYIGKLLPSNIQTIVQGCRYKLLIQDDSNQFLAFHDSGTIQCEVRAMVDGSIGVYSGATQVAVSSPGIISTNTWFYLELKIKFSNTVGTVDVQLNGASIISETGLDTCVSANEYINNVSIWSNNGNVYVDDFYLCDTSGTVNNTFLGDIAITTLYPTSDGNSSDFTPSTGIDHYALVDEPQLAADTDHNESSTVGHKDTYGVTTFSGTGAILGVQVVAAVRNTDVGTMNVRTLCRSGAILTDNEGADFALSQTIKAAMHVFEKEPTDAVAWTAAKINAAEFGVKVQS